MNIRNIVHICPNYLPHLHGNSIPLNTNIHYNLALYTHPILLYRKKHNTSLLKEPPASKDNYKSGYKSHEKQNTNFDLIFNAFTGHGHKTVFNALQVTSPRTATLLTINSQTLWKGCEKDLKLLLILQTFKNVTNQDVHYCHVTMRNKLIKNYVFTIFEICKISQKCYSPVNVQAAKFHSNLYIRIYFPYNKSETERQRGYFLLRIVFIFLFIKQIVLLLALEMLRRHIILLT